MLGQMMQVGFYGHVRQYKNIQSEIDANIRRVLESGEYVQGPMLKQFETGTGGVSWRRTRRRDRERHRRDLAGADGDGHWPRR